MRKHLAHGSKRVSAAILAGGTSSRMGVEKGLASLAGKPMILYVIEACRVLTGDVFVVAGSSNMKDYAKRLASVVEVIPDVDVGFKSPLVGAYTAFSHRREEYVLLLPCDVPLVKPIVLSFLREIAEGWDAVVPRWPSGYIEPLVAVYNAGKALQAIEEALRRGYRDMRGFIERIKTLYVSTLVIGELDPELETFFNVNTPNDFRLAEEKLIRRGRRVA
ncbi:MAG: molybdenum cofactor guanylyltransferase [Candidatus Jordarchaeales archaeon]|nr:molybdenum cofactor guanylyltransferase [Candidatus Jordarchaeia archaeon]